MLNVWTASELEAIELASKQVLAYEAWIFAQRKAGGRVRNGHPEDAFPGLTGEKVICAACPDSWRRQAAMEEEALRLAEILRGGRPASVYAEHYKQDTRPVATGKRMVVGLRKKRVA